MGKFRNAMLRDLQRLELAPTTIDAYLRGARGLVAYYMRPPDALGSEEVRAYADHLRDRGLSPSSRAVYQSGIRFLYAVTLNRPQVVAFLRRPKVPLRKIRVLKGREIRQLMDALPLPQHRAVFAVAYGCGLRVSEACQLRIEDIDSERDRILVRQAKGAKDRYVPLGPTILKELRRYYVERRPAGPYLFPGRAPRRADMPIVTRTFHRALTTVLDHLGFVPRVTPHHLRHAYACHQLELGVELGVLQLLLGHADPRSTAHVPRRRPRLAAGFEEPCRGSRREARRGGPVIYYAVHGNDGAVAEPDRGLGRREKLG